MTQPRKVVAKAAWLIHRDTCRSCASQVTKCREPRAQEYLAAERLLERGYLKEPDEPADPDVKMIATELEDADWVYESKGIDRYLHLAQWLVDKSMVSTRHADFDAVVKRLSEVSQRFIVIHETATSLARQRGRIEGFNRAIELVREVEHELSEQDGNRE